MEGSVAGEHVRRDDTRAEVQGQEGWDMSVEVRRKPGGCWTQNAGEMFSRPRGPQCCVKGEARARRQASHVTAPNNALRPWGMHFLWVAGAEGRLWWVEKQVGREHVGAACADFSSEKAGCDWKTHGGAKGISKCGEGRGGEKRTHAWAERNDWNDGDIEEEKVP